MRSGRWIWVPLLAACATAHSAFTELSHQVIVPCYAAEAKRCYDQGLALLATGKPELAQGSFELVAAACGADLREACDLGDRVFHSASDIAGRGGSCAAPIQARCILDADGQLSDCENVAKSAPLERQLLEALKQRRFQPATWDGKPVDSPVYLRLDCG
jgi:hypothetical protein